MEQIESDVPLFEPNNESTILFLESKKETSPLPKYSPASTTDELLIELNRFRLTGAFCDAILATDDGATYRVHKIAMSLHSNFFRTMFTTPLIDKRSGRLSTPHTLLSDMCYALPKVSSSVLEAIIKFSYSGIVHVDKYNVNELLPAADQFNVVGIVDECVKYLLENINSENCIGIWRFGKEYFMPVLEEEAFRFLLANFTEVSQNSEEFLHLKLKWVEDILNNDGLNVSYEFLVWLAIKRWCQYEFSKRNYFIPYLLMCVRLALLPIADFRQIMDDPRIFKHNLCRAYINIVSKFILSDLRDIATIFQDKKAVMMFTPRHPYEIIIAGGGWSLTGPTNIFEVYDCRADIWKMIFMEDFGSRSYHQTVSLGDYIYVIGGSNGETCLNSCWRIYTKNLKVAEISPMQQKRCYLSAATLNDKIYAIGGFDDFDRLKSVECFDHHQNQWTYISPMIEKRSDASASPLRNRIFVVGGFNGEHFLQSAECYFVDFDHWCLLPPMLSCRSGVGCIAFGDSVYAIGGYDGERRLKSVEKYCLYSKQWIPGKAMQLARSNFAVALMEKKIYVMGGYNDTIDNTTEMAECFDPSKLQWRSIASMQVSRSGLSACTLSGIRDITPFIKDDRFRCLLRNVSIDDWTDFPNT